MNKPIDDAKAILERYRDGTCTPAERRLVEAWYEADPTKPFSLPEEMLREDLLAVKMLLDAARRRKRTLVAIRKTLPYAALLLAALAVSIWLHDRGRQHTAEPTEIASIQPGGNKATLTLADGRSLALRENQTGIIIGEEIRYTDGSRVLDDGGPGKDGRGTDWLSIATPKGGNYQLTLPDGSKVWLNAATKLSYPDDFGSSERRVELIGEGYFSIAPDKRRPFRVVSAGQSVEVIGTEFNISAYPENQRTSTTLVTGIVDLVIEEAAGKTRLAPGQQAVASATGVEVLAVDTKAYTAWKDGLFYFDGMAPQAAFEQLGRWYDIEIVYDGAAPQLPFFGMIDMKKPLHSILQTLQDTGLRFEVVQAGNKRKLILYGE